MPLPPHFQSSNRNLPRRVDSLKASKGPYFSEVDDELRDIKRVYAQGQEEDLRYALSRTINRMEELTLMLKDAYKAQTDLQTELTLAKSNLQLALANNEMLEDALRRDPGSSKDVGWRRMSAREQNLKAEEHPPRRLSSDSLASTEHSPTLSHIHSPIPGIPEHTLAPRSATMPSPAPSTESRFFRFRFGNGSTASVSHPSSPRILSSQTPGLNGSHLTSASLPSLVAPRDWDKEIEDLQHQLETEKKAHKQATDAKVALEGELESLSQALFEEANTMVATERRKLAETEEALREAREQGEALKNVLRLFERDSAAARAHAIAAGTREQDSSAPAAARSRHRASSSAVGVKAPSSGIPSPRSHPSSPVSAFTELSPSGMTTALKSSSTTQQEGEFNGTVTNHITRSPVPIDGTTGTEPLGDADVRVTTASSSSRLPSPSLLQASSSLEDQFLFASPSLNYFDGEESPWADATSATSPRPPT